MSAIIFSITNESGLKSLLYDKVRLRDRVVSSFHSNEIFNS